MRTKRNDDINFATTGAVEKQVNLEIMFVHGWTSVLRKNAFYKESESKPEEVPT
jgi:hypothetical protein